MTRHATLLLGVVILLIGVPAAPAGEGEPNAAAQVVRLPTVGEAIRYLDNSKDAVTPMEFRRWSGVRPDNGANDHRWTLADGVLLTNCIEGDDGKRLISCWGWGTK